MDGMRFWILIIAVFSLTACGQSPTNGESQVLVSNETTTTPTVVNSPLPASTPNPIASPSPSPSSVGPLVCNSVAACTGGNVGSNSVQLDLSYMFTGGNPQEYISNIAVTNGNSASGNTVCSQPSGCVSNSVCVIASIKILGQPQTYSATWCGNAVNEANNSLEYL